MSKLIPPLHLGVFYCKVPTKSPHFPIYRHLPLVEAYVKWTCAVAAKKVEDTHCAWLWKCLTCYSKSIGDSGSNTQNKCISTAWRIQLYQVYKRTYYKWKNKVTLEEPLYELQLLTLTFHGIFTSIINESFAHQWFACSRPYKESICLQLHSILFKYKTAFRFLSHFRACSKPLQNYMTGSNHNPSYCFLKKGNI